MTLRTLAEDSVGVTCSSLFCSVVFSQVKQRESSDVGATLGQIKLDGLNLLVVFKTDKVKLILSINNNRILH